MIPYGYHSVDREEIEAVTQVLEGKWLTQGEMVSQFEKDFSDNCGSLDSCSTSNATAALHLSYLALGLEEGSHVWTTPNTFVATSNAALMCGAKVRFIDIDLASGNMAIDKLENALLQAKANNQLPDVVCIVHFAGHPVDMHRVNKLAEQYQFKVIEDASHAVGAKYKTGETVGCGKYSDLTVFSFHPVKIITTGEGGIITSNNRALISRCKILRSHGIDRDLHNRGNSWEFDQTELGMNYRLTDIQASIGIVQLKKLKHFLERRNSIAGYYVEKLQSSNIDMVLPEKGCYSSYHLFPVLVERRKQVFEAMRNRGVGVSVHYKPVYLHAYYKGLGYEAGLCPSSELFYERELSLPIYPGLKQEQQDQVIDTLLLALQ